MQLQKLQLPCCSLSWYISRCNSTESHRRSASAGLYISPETQSWAFNSFCPTPGYQESEETRRAQQEPGAATMSDGNTPPATRDQPGGGRYPRVGDSVSLTSGWVQGWMPCTSGTLLTQHSVLPCWGTLHGAVPRPNASDCRSCSAKSHMLES